MLPSHAKIIIIRLLGGKNYWHYGVEQFHKLAREKNIQIYFLSGDNAPHTDPELVDYTTGDKTTRQLLENYWSYSGLENITHSLLLLNATTPTPIPPPKEILPAGLYGGAGDYDFNRWLAEKPAVVIMFYRAHFQSGQTALIDKIIQGLAQQNITAVAIYLNASKDPTAKKNNQSFVGGASTTTYYQPVKFYPTR